METNEKNIFCSILSLLIISVYSLSMQDGCKCYVRLNIALLLSLAAEGLSHNGLGQ